MVTFNAYTTAKPFLGAMPSWLSPEDAERIEAYALYEAMYWNVPDTFKLVQRGTDSNPVYIPSAKIIVEATNRFLAKDWDYVIDPRFGTPEQQNALNLQMLRLFRREQMYTKFATQKRFGLIRGDVVWHITADPAKPEGRRISVYEVDPASYFPIYEEFGDNNSRIIGCHLVDQYEFKKKTVIRRQTYRKTETGTITTETALFEMGKWDDRSPDAELKKVAQVVPPTPLPPEITALPVYHVRNFRTPGEPYGSSELRGLERIMASVNQTISDQELAIALDGLGVYATTSGPPVDEDGNETNWVLGPGRVVEIEENSKFDRVGGISGLPGLEHVKFIMGKAQEASGVPNIAVGDVDVQVAESGIALYMHMSPLLAKNAEKEQEMLGVYDHMLYDITHMWLPVYESFGDGMDCEIASVVSDPMPQNRSAQVEEIIKLATSTPPLISMAYARMKLTELGYSFPENMEGEIVSEVKALTEARSFDPFANRVNEELAGADD